MNLDLDCSSIYTCGQSILHSPELYFSLLSGILIFLGIYWLFCFLKNPPRNPSKTTKSCLSNSCVRCHQGKNIQEIALKIFLNLENFENFKRLKTSILHREEGIKKLLDHQNPQVLFIPDLNFNRFLDTDYQEDLQILENNFCTIKEEFGLVYNSKLYSTNWKTNVTERGEWSLFYLMNQGKYIENNCELCPKTSEIVNSLKNVMKNCLFGNIAFSVLQPGTKIDEHHGPTNARIRCHLGLITPPEACLSVGNETRDWKTGKCFLFDDSFLHSAQNGAGIRVILMIDFWNPFLLTSEREILQKCYAP